jgi:hypothetical protein
LLSTGNLASLQEIVSHSLAVTADFAERSACHARSVKEGGVYVRLAFLSRSVAAFGFVTFHPQGSSIVEIGRKGE